MTTQSKNQGAPSFSLPDFTPRLLELQAQVTVVTWELDLAKDAFKSINEKLEAGNIVEAQAIIRQIQTRKSFNLS